jgi:hypothetical protein
VLLLCWWSSETQTAPAIRLLAPNTGSGAPQAQACADAQHAHPCNPASPACGACHPYPTQAAPAGAPWRNRPQTRSPHATLLVHLASTGRRRACLGARLLWQQQRALTWLKKKTPSGASSGHGGDCAATACCRAATCAWLAACWCDSARPCACACDSASPCACAAAAAQAGRVWRGRASGAVTTGNRRPALYATTTLILLHFAGQRRTRALSGRSHPPPQPPQGPEHNARPPYPRRARRTGRLTGRLSGRGTGRRRLTRQARLSLHLHGRAAARLRLRLSLRLRHGLRMRGLHGRMRRVRLRHLLLKRLQQPSFQSEIR